MCGICGLYGLDSSEDGRRLVTGMTQTLVHRGPDGTGIFVDGPVALGHRRLSVIDLSSSGAQPMTHAGATVTYNGESYNFLSLRAELQSAGHAFLGHSDTEVLLHAYEEWGLAGLERLEGIFAFALWDAPRRRLILMRDRLGIKPLYFARRGRRLAFGSEIKAVLAGIEADRAVDEQAFAEYLWYGNAFEDRTIYRGVRVLPPGGRLIVEPGRDHEELWWRVETWLGRPAPPSAAMAAASVRDAVDGAVRRQLVSDVPVGLFLSGGIDSSSIAASAALAAARRLSSFSVAFDYEGGVNELPKAALVARRFGFDHHEIQVRGENLEEVLQALVESHDEPFADAANIPLFLLARQLRGQIKVVLQGDGGDELFAGYRRYALLAAAPWWGLWPRLLGSALRALPGSAPLRLARLGEAAGHTDPALRMALLLTLETLQDPPSNMLSNGAATQLQAVTDPFAAFRRCAARFAHADPVQRMLLTDLCLQLPSQFLAKVDRATMANGIEARVPLLDEGVAALAANLPAAYKVRGVQKKLVLRAAMRQRLPAAILDSPKRGFGVPYEEWLRTSLYAFARASILDRVFVERFGFDRDRLQAALEEHQARHRERGFLLWKLLQLALWSKRYQS
jgi:asparagine synthase (glutamine-hydrolysing)